MSPILFLVLAFLLVVCALSVILQPSPIRSGLSLVVTLFLLAAVFLFLDAYLLAALQVIVYAGAIMVLFLFVIMLLNLQGDRQVMVQRGARYAAAGLTSIFVLAASTFFFRDHVDNTHRGFDQSVDASFGSTEEIARRLFTDYLFAFEITGVLLLVAVVGAVVMAKQRLT